MNQLVKRNAQMTLSITEDDKRYIKKYAIDHNTTVSELLHQMIVNLQKERTKS